MVGDRRLDSKFLPNIKSVVIYCTPIRHMEKPDCNMDDYKYNIMLNQKEPCYCQHQYKSPLKRHLFTYIYIYIDIYICIFIYSY